MSEILRFITLVAIAVLCLTAYFMLRKMRKESEREGK